MKRKGGEEKEKGDLELLDGGARGGSSGDGGGLGSSTA